MTRFEWALFFHLLGVVLFFSGAAVAAAGLESARRRERPAEIALLLGLARRGVLVVIGGMVVLLVFGLWLVDLGDWDFGDAWISAALALLIASAAIGAIGGRQAKRVRLLAEQLAAEGAAVSEELRRRLDDPLARALNYGSGLLGLAILGLMVFKP